MRLWVKVTAYQHLTFTTYVILSFYYRAVFLGYQAIRNEDADVVVCGGQENMTMAEHSAFLRGSVRYGDVNFRDTILKDGLTDAIYNIHMGNTGNGSSLI